ncbi:MAG: isoprenoid biosynthesis glyoxalase ElbB [FCB group bacterium]|nr:isoprenoid biosynthesis glyoxalase ElbB [FCB group bacterium]
MKKRIAIILSGCGVNDGTEIHEAVAAMIALDNAGFEMIFVAPDMEQASSINHLDSDIPQAPRDVLVESARIARGDIKDIRRLLPSEYDAILIPGGFGAAKNLSTFAKDGPLCTVIKELADLIHEALEDGKPIAAMCIAPVILAKTIPGAKVTLGTSDEIAGAIRAMGGIHVPCNVANAVVDEKNKLITTPAYMLAKGPAEVFAGAKALVAELEKLL